MLLVAHVLGYDYVFDVSILTYIHMDIHTYIHMDTHALQEMDDAFANWLQERDLSSKFNTPVMY